MALKELDNDLSFVLFQTTSDLMRIFIQDKLKKTNNNSTGNIFIIENKKDFKEALSTCNVQPFGADKWLFIIDTNKMNLSYKDLKDIVRNNSSGVFLVEVHKYKEYKRIKNIVGDSEGFLDLYLPRLRRDDFLYLYDYYTPSWNKLTPKLYNQIYRDYSNDVDAVMNLFKAMQNGTRVTSIKDVTLTVGVAGNTVESYIISLLKEPPTTAKGAEIIIRNRVKSGLELAEVHGYEKMWVYMVSCIKSFTDIKILMINGIVYKKIQTELPEGYDDKKLFRYQKYIWRLESIPLSRVIRLRYALQRNKWQSGEDFLRFIYDYMYSSIKSEVVDAGKAS